MHAYRVQVPAVLESTRRKTLQNPLHSRVGSEGVLLNACMHAFAALRSACTWGKSSSPQVELNVRLWMLLLAEGAQPQSLNK